MQWIFGWMTACAVATHDDPLTCEQLDHQVQQTLRDVAAAHRDCTGPTDCEVVWLSVTCSQSCSDVVGVGGVAAFDAALDEAENGICADHPTCAPSALPCDAPGPVDCVDGTCTEADL